jgi:D-alanyl-D-alanine-carboxypeptidase/D-alanyl-D-alanine-endopeptidase
VKSHEAEELKMIDRREFLLGSIATGISAARGGLCETAPETESIRAMLKQTVGANEKVVGMVAVTVDERGIPKATFGSSGVPGLALGSDTVFEIASITKVLTSLLLVEMVRRGEVAFNDPVAKYLPASLTLHQRGRPITLLDLASYTSGLPNMPDNMPPKWWTLPNPMVDYTERKLYEFLSSYVPEYEPGIRYEYANLGFGLLGVALARRAGKSYEELMIERVCNPLGLYHTRITLSDDMRRHLVQPHDKELKPTPLWDMQAMAGGGAFRSDAKDLTMFLKACMGLKQTPLSASIARLVETRTPTRLAGTEAALGWFITSAKDEEFVWKTGGSGGCNSFIGFSTRNHRGAVVLSNFRWSDQDTINLGMKLIDPHHQTIDFAAFFT